MNPVKNPHEAKLATHLSTNPIRLNFSCEKQHVNSLFHCILFWLIEDKILLTFLQLFPFELVVFSILFWQTPCRIERGS